MTIQFVPVVEGATIGNADLTGSAVPGLSLHVELVLGTASAIYGPVVFVLPSSFIPGAEIVGTARDVSAGAIYALHVQREDDRLTVQAWEAVPYRHSADLSGTVPFTWAPGDRITLRAGPVP